MWISMAMSFCLWLFDHADDGSSLKDSDGESKKNNSVNKNMN